VPKIICGRFVSIGRLVNCAETHMLEYTETLVRDEP